MNEIDEPYLYVLQNYIAGYSTRYTFSDVVGAAITAPLTRALAAKFEVSPKTVERWAIGKSRPHPRLKAQVIAYLNDYVTDALAMQHPLHRVLRNMRHLYEQMIACQVHDTKAAAVGLLEPAIGDIEIYLTSIESS